jgi:hypothetical protein
MNHDPKAKPSKTTEQVEQLKLQADNAVAANDDFDEELTLPETSEALNRMGMDTISCVGCQ